MTLTTQADFDFQKNQDGEVPSAYYINASCKDLETPSLDAFFAANTSPMIKKIGSATVGGKAAIAVNEGAGEAYSLWVSREKLVIFDFSYTTTTADDLTPIQQAILSSITFSK